MSLHNFMRIPAELRALPQWVNWNASKEPLSPKGQWRASVTDPNTWASFEQAVSAYEAAPNIIKGIGFVFTPNDPYCGIDLDASADPERCKKIFEAFNSYTETSPSGKGAHIIIKATLPTGRRREGIEIYSSQRFFTMTGNVFNDVPIAENQTLATMLWEELGRVKNYSNWQGDDTERVSDESIIEQGSNAANGDKFKALLAGRWQDFYSSQSEADFALMDMLAFYSRARQQIVRIFRSSGLGQRDKAQRSAYVGYMLDKCFDRQLPPVDIEGLAIQAQETIQTYAATPLPDISEPSPYTPPPGLLGDIAQYIYAQAPRPVPEIALAGAIAFLAGITGRAYNVSATGLNQYILLLAETGSGKEAIGLGINKLISAIQMEVPAARSFVGPARIASGQALIKHLSNKSQCFVSVVGEFGLQLQTMSARNASNNEIILRSVLLDLYHKSGRDGVVNETIYSDKENNTKPVYAPNVTIMGESTASTFLAAIDEKLIEDGLLPRFIIIEYNGECVPLNKQHHSVSIPNELIEKLISLSAYCLQMQHGVNGQSQISDVALTAEADAMSDEFEAYARGKLNSTKDGVVKQLWNRAHLKLLKLAALVAVGCNPYQPTIEVQHIEWAKRLVVHDVNKLSDRFHNGDIGATQGEREQTKAVARVLYEYATKEWSELHKLCDSEKMHKDMVVPRAYLTRRIARIAVMYSDRNGAVSALDRILKLLKDSDIIVEIAKHQIQEAYGVIATGYMIKRLDLLVRA